MKRNVYKIILDVIMAGLLILMYKARVINLAFHEIGGLIVIGLFLVHKGISWKWIKAITKRLFARGIPGRTRLLYVLDVIILLSVTVILVSGIMISHTVFSINAGRGYFWKPLHYSSSALALLLIGVHIGLHWAYIRNFFSKLIKLPAKLGRLLGIMLLILVLGFGVYSLVESRFLPWLASPLSADLLSEGTLTGGGGGRRGGGKGAHGVQGNLAEGNANLGEGLGRQDEDTGSLNASLGLGRGENDAERDHEEEAFAISNVVYVLATYTSIAAVFAFLAWLIDEFFRRRKPARARSTKPAGQVSGSAVTSAKEGTNNPENPASPPSVDQA